jgi:Spy/CpxP family protein refolding chaperone
MKTPQLFITVSCLLLFAAIGQTQQEEQPATPSPEEIARLQTLETSFQKSFLESLVRQHWDNQGLNAELLQALGEPAIRAAWGISEEQRRQIDAHAASKIEHINESMSGSITFSAVKNEETGDINFTMALTDTNVTPEEMQSIAEKIMELTANVQLDAMNSTLTSEQWQKMNESLLANIGEMPIISPNMFVALDLTDAQKEQMEQIKKVLEPEFEKTLENWVNGELTLMEKMVEALKKEERTPRPSATKLRQELMAKDPEFKRIYEENQSKGKAFSTKFKTQMFDVLTDEQWARLQKLIDNPPEHALVFRKHLKKQQGESEDTKKTEMWIPGPGAWQPGQGIPEGYRIERNSRSRFPRGGN